MFYVEPIFDKVSDLHLDISVYNCFYFTQV